MNTKAKIAAMPLVGPLLRRLKRCFCNQRQEFVKSAEYWEDRYKSGGNSGAGSYNELAEFKAEVLNELVTEHGVHGVIEFGCGDGNQLTLADYPQYTGYDVSPTAIDICRDKFQEDLAKRFVLVDEYDGQRADLTLSLDVIYHLVEDEVFHDYMSRLFAASDRLVVIYASNQESPISAPRVRHVKHRKFTDWVEVNAPDFALIRKIDNKFPGWVDTGKSSFADFFVYQKT